MRSHHAGASFVDVVLLPSQMLRACATIAPLAVFVSGNTTTTTGLTVTMSKEGGKGDLGLEAGALVLADRVRPSLLSSLPASDLIVTSLALSVWVA